MTIAARKNLQLRYSILKFYYSLYLRYNRTGAIFKPLFFEYFDDDTTLENQKILNNHFAVGSQLIFTPVVYPNTT